MVFRGVHSVRFEEEVLAKLDRIIELLELQTFVPEDAVPAGCQHANVLDHTTMGMPPRSLLECKDCGEMIRRV